MSLTRCVDGVLAGRRALQVNSNNSVLYCHLGTTYARLQDTQNALLCFENVRVSNDDFSYACLCLHF